MDVIVDLIVNWGQNLWLILIIKILEHNRPKVRAQGWQSQARPQTYDGYSALHTEHFMYLYPECRVWILSVEC